MSAHSHPGAEGLSSRRHHASRKPALRKVALAVSAGLLSCGVAVLASVPAVSAASQTVVSGNPLAGAAGFTVVTFGDLSLGNHELEGSIAAGGNIAVTSASPFTVIHAATGSSNYILPTLGGTPVRVVSGGRYDMSAGGMLEVTSAGSTGPATEGRMIFGDTSNSAVASRGAGVCVQTPGRSDCQGAVAEQSAYPQSIGETTNPNAFNTLVTADGKASLNAWNAAIDAGQISAAPATAAASSDGLSVTLTPGTTNLLTLDASALPQFHWVMRFSGAVPSADTPLIINVRTPDGALVRLPAEAVGMYSSSSTANAYAPYMLWNIDQAEGSSTQIATDGISPGSILAPNSHLTEPSTIPGTGEPNKGLIEGQIIAATATFQNQGELHNYAFLPQLNSAALAPSPSASVASPSPSASVASPSPSVASLTSTRTGATVDTGGYLVKAQPSPLWQALVVAILAAVIFMTAGVSALVGRKRNR